MLKRYTFWLWLAVVFMFLTGAIHGIALFVPQTPTNDTERQMLNLVMNYNKDMGAGFHRSLWNLFTALSACYTFVSFLGGLTLAFLLKKKAPVGILKGVVGIHVIIFIGVFGVMLAFTFLPPIVLSGLVALFLTIGWVTTPKSELGS